MATDNQRSHPRFDSLNLLSYVVHDADGTVVRQGMGRTLNVSETGILIETHLPVAPKSEIALSVGFEDRLVDLRGKAVFSKPKETKRFATGVEFIEMDETQKRFLKAFIEAFESQKA